MTTYTIPIQIYRLENLSLSTDDEDLDTYTTNQSAGLHVFVKVVVGDQQMEMVIDTGASQTVVDPDFAPQFIEYMTGMGEIQSSSINAEVAIEPGTLNQFSIGDLKIDRLHVGLTSMQHINMVYSRISNKKVFGLLGGETLMKYNAIIDYGKRTLTLFA